MALAVHGHETTSWGRLADQAWHGLERAVAKVREWNGRWLSRQELLEMDDRILRDIGLTRGDVLREVSKPFWRR